MELSVLDQSGLELRTISVSDVVFSSSLNESLVHQIVVAYQANGRAVSSKQKGRSEVSHTTAKPWRQKGTGRARSGMSSSPLWRGGGRTFPNSPAQSYFQKVNRKMYRAGVASILSELVRQGRLVVVESLSIQEPKTRLFAQKLKDLGCTDPTLVITDDLHENLYLASRNLPDVLVLEVSEVDPVSLVRYSKILVTQKAVVRLEEMWA